MRNEKSSLLKLLIVPAISLVIGAIVFYSTRNLINSIITFVSLTILISIYLSLKSRAKKLGDIKKIEKVFPDFIELVSSNLRSGMTIDKAILMGSRKEFSPLDERILELGKDITTGKDINIALKDLGERIGSEKINRTIALIISGLKSGGNLAILLEQTAGNLREREFLEKRAESNVLMYVIFIFFAVAIGAPVLFAFSTVLVKIMTSLLANIPMTDTNSALPFTLKSINISVEFVTYFSMIFLAISDILASLLLGLINKGEEKSGVKYMIPLIVTSLGVYLVIKIVFSKYFGAMFS